MLVVGVALVVDGRVLAGLRPGRGWEFPGGKVEPGETPAQALVRECREELAVEIEPDRELGGASAGGIDLRLWSARLVAGTPTAGPDHAELRWVGADGLDALDWLPIDRDLLGRIRPLL